MQLDPAGQRLGLVGGGEGVDQDGVVLPEDEVDVVASQAMRPHGRGRSPMMAFSGAVKTLTLSVDVMDRGYPFLDNPPRGRSMSTPKGNLAVCYAERPPSNGIRNLRT